ncbi:MAG: magnesium transporter [Chloroflexi bacterium]|nr:magnesium transporter [Chloroflexota bacterium]
MTEQVPDLQIAIEQIKKSLEEGLHAQAIAHFNELALGDQAEAFNQLEENEQATLLPRLDVGATADLFDRLTDSETLEASENLTLERLADVLEEMQPDEAADLLGDLPPEQASQALEEMEDSEDVLPLLGFPDETAGGRMTTEYIAMRQHTRVEQAIKFLRDVSPDHEVPYYIFVVDREKRLVGVLGLRELVVSDPQAVMEDIMDPDVIYVESGVDQEVAANVLVRHELSAIPVVDEQKRMLGVITHDDILDVLSEEATEDIYRLASVGAIELEPESPVRMHIRGRLPWLYLNTLTALFAAWIISHYEVIIAQVAALAVFQSVVAGMGGNASSQTVAVIVRSLALGKTSPSKVWVVLWRELVVGILQGLAVGLLVALGVWLWRGNPYLGVVVGGALMANLIVAGLAGAIIPMALKSMGQDPALASSVLVTAVTDSLGFLIFLSLAGYFLPHLF